jgi:hypothetical protein
MSNKKHTSSPIASKASQMLHDKSSSEVAKQLAGSALSQVNKGNETGKAMETIASNVLKSDKYSNSTKALAASVLAQSDKSR